MNLRAIVISISSVAEVFVTNFLLEVFQKNSLPFRLCVLYWWDSTLFIFNFFQSPGIPKHIVRFAHWRFFPANVDWILSTIPYFYSNIWQIFYSCKIIINSNKKYIKEEEQEGCGGTSLDGLDTVGGSYVKLKAMMNYWIS